MAEDRGIAADERDLSDPNIMAEPKGALAPRLSNRCRRQGLSDLDGWKAYVAEPAPMVEAAMQIGTARGLRPEDVHADVFFTPDEASARS